MRKIGQVDLGAGSLLDVSPIAVLPLVPGDFPWKGVRAPLIAGEGSGVTAILLGGASSGLVFYYDDASDDSQAWTIPLERDGVPYDGSDLQILVAQAVDNTVPGSGDNVKWIVEYALLKDDGTDDPSTKQTAAVETTIDVNGWGALEMREVTLNTIPGVAGAKLLSFNLIRNSTGTGSDTYGDVVYVSRVKANKVGSGSPPGPTVMRKLGLVDLATGSKVGGASPAVSPIDKTKIPWTPPANSSSLHADGASRVFATTGWYFDYSDGASDAVHVNQSLENNGVAYDGSTLYVRVFFALTSTPGGADVVQWQLKYAFCGDNTGDDPETAGATAATLLHSVGGLTAARLYSVLVPTAGISGSAGDVELQFSLIRLGVADTYNANVRVFGILPVLS